MNVRTIETPDYVEIEARVHIAAGVVEDNILRRHSWWNDDK